MSDDHMIQFLNPDGEIVSGEAREIPNELAKKMYRFMILTRAWNTKALSLQRQGRLGTYGSVKGQEASNVGMGLALQPRDWFSPSFREIGAEIVLGVKLSDLFRYWGGDERGMKRDTSPEATKVLPVCITIASQMCHAAGVAWAAKIKKENIAVLSSSGEGSSSQGDFHESLNFASVFQLPVVFAIQNNYWAISTPLEKQSATKTISERALAYNMNNIRVDGNDVFAVYFTLKHLLDRARGESKPSLAELVTYRMDDHTTSDDATRYRTEEMLAPWRKKDPIDRLHKYLIKTINWGDKEENELVTQCQNEVEQAVNEYEATPTALPTDIFNYYYKEEPWYIREEREEVKRVAMQIAK